MKQIGCCSSTSNDKGKELVVPRRRDMVTRAAKSFPVMFIVE